MCFQYRAADPDHFYSIDLNIKRTKDNIIEEMWKQKWCDYLIIIKLIDELNRIDYFS